jgi:hypothetical protein
MLSDRERRCGSSSWSWAWSWAWVEWVEWVEGVEEVEGVDEMEEKEAETGSLVLVSPPWLWWVEAKDNAGETVLCDTGDTDDIDVEGDVVGCCASAIELEGEKMSWD